MPDTSASRTPETKVDQTQPEYRLSPVRTPDSDIGVALATFNSARYLKQQIESVLAQTLQPRQIVVSDDGSTDDTLEILASYAQRDERIVITRNGTHRTTNRINRNFENAARHCTTRWIAFCDHDDVWLPQKLDLLYRNRNGASLVYGRSQPIDERGVIMPVRTEDLLGFTAHLSGNVPPLIFMHGNTVSGHALLVPREILDQAFPFPCGMMYDQWIALVAACKGPIRFVDETVVLHRVHEDNSVHRRIGPGTKSLHHIPEIISRREKLLLKQEIADRVFDFRADLTEKERLFLNEYRSHLHRKSRYRINWRLFLAGYGIRRRLYMKNSAWRLLKQSILV